MLAPLEACSSDTRALAFADQAVRAVLSSGLEAARLGAAAGSIRALPPMAEAENAKRTMIALERVARAHAAPEPLVRAAHGVAACALSLQLTGARGSEALTRAEGQLVSAIVRLVTATVRSGVSAERVVACLVPSPERLTPR